jgi:hypothetical protein
MGILHSALIDMGYRWLLRSHNGNDNNGMGYLPACGIVLKDYKSYSDAIPDVIGFASRHSVVIECKASRKDFLADSRKGHRDIRNNHQLGNYRFFLTPFGMIDTAELPENWGLLVTSGKQIMIVKAASFLTHPEIRCAEYTLLYSMLRRLELRHLLSDIQKPLRRER